MREWAPRPESACMRATVMIEHATPIAGRLAMAFVELMLADTKPEDPHFSDLVEVRAAAVAAANMINRGQAPGGGG